MFVIYRFELLVRVLSVSIVYIVDLGVYSVFCPFFNKDGGLQ